METRRGSKPLRFSGTSLKGQRFLKRRQTSASSTNYAQRIFSIESINSESESWPSLKRNRCLCYKQTFVQQGNRIWRSKNRLLANWNSSIGQNIISRFAFIINCDAWCQAVHLFRGLWSSWPFNSTIKGISSVSTNQESPNQGVEQLETNLGPHNLKPTGWDKPKRRSFHIAVHHDSLLVRPAKL